MDVGLHNKAVTLVLDRAGVTGDDGPSHHGMWDIALLRTVPNLRLAAPRDEDTLRRALREAVAIDGPTAVRYPKGPLPDPIPALDTIAGLDVIGRHPGERNVLVVGVGAMAGRAIEVGRALDAQGIGSLVIDPRWVLPVSPALVDLAAHYELVVHIEDGLVEGGAGSALRDALAAAGARVPVQAHGVPRGFHHHAKREELLDEFHLRPADVARQVAGALLAPDVARLDEAAGLLALEEPES